MAQFIDWMRAVAKAHDAKANAPKPLRTPTPLQLSQETRVEISPTPMILADTCGSLFKDFPTDHHIVAVGQFSLHGLNFYRPYLSNGDGGFIHFAVKDGDIMEARLYRRYADPQGQDVIPPTAQDWAFWLADADGYIGAPVMQSRDTDGAIPYQRSWGGNSNARVAPASVIESVVDSTGATTTMRHKMMHYSRLLDDKKTAEHLLVSAVETSNDASVVFWLGIDLAATDLTVYAAADAPAFAHGAINPRNLH